MSSEVVTKEMLRSATSQLHSTIQSMMSAHELQVKSELTEILGDVAFLKMDSARHAQQSKVIQNQLGTLVMQMVALRRDMDDLQAYQAAPLALANGQGEVAPLKLSAPSLPVNKGPEEYITIQRHVSDVENLKRELRSFSDALEMISEKTNTFQDCSASVLELKGLTAAQEKRLDAVEKSLKYKEHNGNSATSQSDAAGLTLEDTTLSDTQEDQKGSQSQTRAISIATSIEVEATLKRAQMEIEEDFYQFQLSVYDCSLLVFSELVYLEDSLAILFGVFACIAIQLTMLLLVFSVQLDDPFKNWRTIAWDFRLAHGHDWETMIPGPNMSLTRAICVGYPSLPFKSQQRELIEKIETYTTTIWGIDIFPQGLSMIMMILVLWICQILEEIRNAFKMAFAISAIPHSCGSPMRLKQVQASGQFSVASIGVVRLFFVRYICFMRLFVGCSLCGIGCVWLCQTLDIEELLLNAISLVFIVDVDETILKLLVSEEVHWMMTNMAPLPSPACFANRSRCNHYILTALGIVTGGAVWVFMMFVYAKPFLGNLHDVHDLYCGGFQDFVVRRDLTSGSLQVVQTNANFSRPDPKLLGILRQNIGMDIDS